MADFDSVRKEVAELEVTYEKLHSSIPVLEEERFGLADDLNKLQKEIILAEGKLSNTQAMINTAESAHKDKLASDKAILKAKVDEFEKYKLTENEKFEEQNANLSKQLSEIKTEKNDLANLLEKQVELKMDTEQQKLEIDKLVEEHNHEITEFKVQKEAFEADYKQFKKEQVDHTKHTEAIEEALDRKQDEAQNMTKEAESKLKRAQELLDKGKQRISLASLKEDELSRKEVLLKSAQGELKKKQAALDDRAAVYSSNKM